MCLSITESLAYYIPTEANEKILFFEKTKEKVHYCECANYVMLYLKYVFICR